MYYRTLDTLQAGVLIANANRRIEFWNRWLERQSGIEADVACGKTLEQLFPDTPLKRLKHAIEYALQHGQSAVLSHLLQASTLPLYTEPEDPDSKPIIQSIVVKPLVGDTDERLCLVQINDISAGRKREERLRKLSREMVDLAALHKQNEAHARAIIENIADALVTIDGQGNIEDMNSAAHALFGYTDDEVLGTPFGNLIADVDDLDHSGIDNNENRDGIGTRRDGSQFTGEFSVSRVPLDHIDRRIVIARDVTFQKQFEDTLFREKEFAQVTLQSIADAVLTTDAEGVVNWVNQAAINLLGKAEKALLGRPLMKCVLLEQYQRTYAESVLEQALNHGFTGTLCEAPELLVENSRKIAIGSNISSLRERGGSIIGTVTVLHDISTEREMQEKLTYQASHDELTGLINRREFERRLEDLLIRASTEGSESVLIYMDLDQFKLVNDTCGHIAGDQLLRQVTGLLKLKIRNADTLARLGGDEFAVLLPSCGIEIAQRIAEELRNAVSEYRFNWEGRVFGIGVSIGLVAIDNSWQRLDDIMGAADSACYIAKERGRDRVIVYHSDGQEEQQRHGQILWASRIRESLEENRFHLYCQPIVPVNPSANERFSIEILVRMLDDDRKIISPMSFIPAAERYDLMTYIDRWVVENVARALNDQEAVFDSVEKCAINLSGQSIANEEFLEFAVDKIESLNIPWSKICFEITETAAVANISVAQDFINALSNKGCMFSLDDFGSGLSSFTYLKHLRVDFLKIDGAFVKNLLNDPIDAAMVRAISDVAQSMNLRTIGEFVEDQNTLAELRKMSVHYAQGYGICPPFPIEQLDDYRESWKGICKSA